MAYTIDWFVPNKVLYSRVWDVQTIELVQESMVDFKKYLDTDVGTDKPFIHLVFDIREIISIPKSLGQLVSAMDVVRHPSLGWVVTVGTTHPVVKFMGTMLAKLFRLRFRRVETMAEALAFLQEIDPVIDWTQAQPDILPEEVAMP